MTRYRTKPQTVEAVQWRGDNEAEVIDFFGPAARYIMVGSDVAVMVGGINFDFRLNQWIVRGSTGYSVFDDEVFELHYEKIEPREDNEGSD